MGYLPDSQSGWTSSSAVRCFERHRSAWDSLNSKYCDSNPYFDSRFIEPLVRHFGSAKERLWLYRERGELVGAAILSEAASIKESLFVPSQAQIAPVLVFTDRALSTLLRSLTGLKACVAFPCQDPALSPFFGQTALPLTIQQHAHTVSVSLQGSFEEFWRSRSSNIRKNVRRRMRNAESAGYEVKFVHRRAAEEMAAAVTRFGELESRGWKGRAGTAVHSENSQGRFYTEVLQNFAEDGQASVFELYFNETVVAVELAVASPRMVILLKTTFDDQFSKLAPGRLLLFHILREEFRLARSECVEFYTNASADELAWSNNDRWIFNVLLFRNNATRSLYFARKMFKQLVQKATSVKLRVNQSCLL